MTIDHYPYKRRPTLETMNLSNLISRDNWTFQSQERRCHGPLLASEIPPVSIDFSDYIKPVSHVFTLTETSIDTVLKLINSLPLNKACGLDGISCRLLKEVAPIVVPSLTHIINLSIITGIFPDEWKLARVSPIY